MTSDIPDTFPTDRAAELGQDTTTAPGALMVRVPELVGMAANDAHDVALDAGVLAVAENAFHTAAGRARIGRQDPDPGAQIETGGIVRIWIGGDAG